MKLIPSVLRRVPQASFFFLLLFFVLISQPFSIRADAGEERFDVKLTSHRGLTTPFPENSLKAIQAIIEMGLHGVEVDLRTTMDDHIIIIHDKHLERTTTGKGLVSEATWEEIEKLNLKSIDKSGQPAPTSFKVPDFHQVLQLVKQHPHIELALDLKAVDAVKAAKMVLAHGMEKQAHFFIADPMNTALAKSITRLSPDLRITVDMLTWWKIEDVPLFTAKALETDTLFASEWFFPKRGFSHLKKEGVSVIVYLWGQHDLEKRFRRAVELGAGAVSCDNPKILLPFVKPSL